MDKYLNIMGDDEPKACYYRVSIKYAQGLNQETITKADECIRTSGAAPYFKLYGIKGYAYDNLKDSVNAKAAFDEFFKHAKETEVGPTDLKTYASILLKFPGNEVLAGTYIDKAVLLDSTEAGKVALLKSMAVTFEAQKKYAEAAAWYKKILDIKKNPTKTDIFNAATNFSRSGNYQAAIDNWAVYTSKFPNETYGYYMTGVTQNKIDTTMALGMAVPSYQKVVDIGEAQWATDSVKVKAHLLNAYKFFIQYAANVQKDKKAASDHCAKYLAKEPNDAEVQGFKKIFDNPATKLGAPAKPTPPATPAKPAAGGAQTGTGTAKPATAAAKPAVKPAAPPKKK
jgi:tetratricopeptide (TPR) repeat protein